MGWLNDYAPLLLRVCLVVLFPFSARDGRIRRKTPMQAMQARG